MKNEMQISTAEQSQKLYDLGIKNDDAHFWWNTHDGSGGTYDDTNKYWLSEKHNRHTGAMPAFTVAELGVMLVAIQEKEVDIFPSKELLKKYDYDDFITYYNPIAMCDLLIERIEAAHHIVTDINTRLQSA